jgi:hypothetical protein
MTKEIGTPLSNKSNYDKLTPFNNENPAPGNERHLKNTPVRLSYDADIEWQIKEVIVYTTQIFLPDQS